MKKLLIISFAVAVLAIGGGVFIHTALIGSDPILCREQRVAEEYYV